MTVRLVTSRLTNAKAFSGGLGFLKRGYVGAMNGLYRGYIGFRVQSFYRDFWGGESKCYKSVCVPPADSVSNTAELPWVPSGKIADPCWVVEQNGWPKW